LIFKLGEVCFPGQKVTIGDKVSKSSKQLEFEDEIFGYASEFSQYVKVLESDFKSQIEQLRYQLSETQDLLFKPEVTANLDNRFASRVVPASKAEQTYEQIRSILEDSIVSQEKRLEKIEQHKRDAVN
jgi:hypothetical protein